MEDNPAYGVVLELRYKKPVKPQLPQEEEAVYEPIPN